MKRIDIEKIFKNCREWYDIQGLIDFLRLHPNIVGSWGFNNVKIHENTCLSFHVNGHHHAGKVWIFLSANDTFEIYLTDKTDTIKDFFNEVYIEELIDRLDKKIEWIDTYNNEIK
jgi:hypothetical protein